MGAHSSPRPRVLGATVAVAALALAVAAGLLVIRRSSMAVTPTVVPGVPEQLVWSRTADGVLNAGAMFARAAPPPANAICVIWVHGWGVNFYEPSYAGIGRRLADLGFAALTVNTRMHDIGFNIGERDGKRIRGGGYWGVTSDQVRDVAAWINLAEKAGYPRVVLVGHSAGWAAVRLYQAQTQDARVVGVVLASGAVRPDLQQPDPEMLAQARRLVAEGHEDDLIRFPNRRAPSFVSPATYLDIATNYPAEERDFFGVQTANPGVTRIRCPLLAFFGTNESDVGTKADLDLLKSSIAEQPTGPSRVTTAMIDGAEHMYAGHEAAVAKVIADWIGTL